MDIDILHSILIGLDLIPLHINMRCSLYLLQLALGFLETLWLPFTSAREMITKNVLQISSLLFQIVSQVVLMFIQQLDTVVFQFLLPTCIQNVGCPFR